MLNVPPTLNIKGPSGLAWTLVTNTDFSQYQPVTGHLSPTSGKSQRATQSTQALPREPITGRDKNGYKHKPEPEILTAGRPAHPRRRHLHTLPRAIQQSLVDPHRDNHQQTPQHPSLTLLHPDKPDRSSRQPTLHYNTRIVYSNLPNSRFHCPRRRQHPPSRMVAPASSIHRPHVAR